jgi:hypothetical protein
MTPEHEQYRRRKAEQEAKYKSQFLERWFGWWRDPPDRFAALVAVFTGLLFAATVGLWIATKDLVEDARSSSRAWLGPTNAVITSTESGKPIKVAIAYGNTGRQPAPTNFYSYAKIYSAAQWDDGTAVNEIISAKDTCLAVKETTITSHITYPTTSIGSGFSVIFDSSNPHGDPASRFLASEGLDKGTDIFMIRGCMVYETIEAVHHSAFCYFYQFPTTDRQHLSYCNVGQAAD